MTTFDSSSADVAVEGVRALDPLDSGSQDERSPNLLTGRPTAVDQVLARTVNQLFGVTLTLTAIAARADAEMSGRLFDAIGQVDAAILRLRRSLLVPSA